MPKVKLGSTWTSNFFFTEAAALIVAMVATPLYISQFYSI